ncbi:sensor histidine kinase [Vicingaceae bacterium]|nr:sensor histidine kinase [Vicingaceae bacterium]
MLQNYLQNTIRIILLLIPFAGFSANNTIIFNDSKEIIKVNSGLSIYEDKGSQLNVNEVLRIDSFKASDQKVPNLGISSSTFWVKFSVCNNSEAEHLILSLAYPILDFVEFYEIKEGRGNKISTVGDNFSFDQRKYKHQNFLFDLNIKQNETKKYILKVNSWELITVPLKIGSYKSISESNLTQDLIFGLFFGIMLVLMLYNLFIYFTVKDNSYLYYVIYISFITLTQASLYGYAFRLFFSGSPSFSNLSLIIFNSISGIATIEFLKLFLKTKKFTPTLHKGLYLLTVIYSFGIITALFGLKSLGYKLMDFGGVLIAFYTLFLAIKISLKDYRPAKIFLAAWSIFLLGVIFFVLKSVGILPSNIYTNYTMTFGIAIEGILLSIALADRINILRAEKEDSQKKTVEALKENEEIIKNQNVVLEQKVDERTNELNNALDNLKQTQSQLVEAEKMSSLGKLTAGIAHEINNPINFVSSNIMPLRQDIDDINTILNKYEELTKANIPEKLKEIEELKEELDFEYLKTELSQIIDGIEDGANRTAEIVSGLKNFSRLEEDGFKIADINSGINSSLLLVKGRLNKIKTNIELDVLPEIECNPGKINQLIINLLDNAIYAINKKNIDGKGGLIKVKTSSDEESITISISDNGIGIPEKDLSQLYDPFFTTKDVGEGTGLGLSIVKGIIDRHNATIKIKSTEMVGTEIIVEIPKNK